MPRYLIKFYRSDKKKDDTAVVTAPSMKAAVSEVVTKAQKRLVTLSNITCSISSEKKGGSQKFCDVCKFDPASYFKYTRKSVFDQDKSFCKNCKPF